MMLRLLRTAAAVLVAWLTFMAGLATASPSGLVISQVYGGGGNSGATLRHDFVELFNAGTAAVNIGGWSLQYASATGSAWGSNVFALPAATVQPGQYFLVQLAAGSGGTQNLPAPDATGALALGATAGKVALVTSTTALSGANPAPGSYEDLVGYGASANGSETAPTASLSNTTAALRRAAGCTDANNNGADFDVGAPAPRNSASPLAPCGAVVASCPAFATVSGIAGSSTMTANDADALVNAVAFEGAPPAGILLGSLVPAAVVGASARVRVEAAASLAVGSHAFSLRFTSSDGQSAVCASSVAVGAPPAVLTPTFTIQGSGAASPMVGQAVVTRGVVTGVFAGLRGFFFQDETGDGDAFTSDAIFVFTGVQAITVEAGERVQVAGSVGEYSGAPGQLTLTQISSPTGIAKLGLGSIAPTPVSLPEATDGDLERYEGMLISIAQPLIVAQNFFQGRYGQVTLAAGSRPIKPTNLFRPGTPEAVSLADANARARLVLDDGRASEFLFAPVENPNPVPYIGAGNTLRAGDTVAGLTGILDSGRITSASGSEAIVDVKLHPTVTPVFTRVNQRPAIPPVVGGTHSVASFNVLNFFTTFGDGNTAAGGSGQGCLPSGTTSDCRGADNLGEYQRQRDKIVRAIDALNADVVGLMELQRDGGTALATLIAALNAHAGSNKYAAVPDPPTGVGTDAIRQALIYQPARLSLIGAAAGDTAAIHNRPPIAQTFQAGNGARFTVVVNHFKSKNCDGATGADVDQGDGQGCFNDRRRQQAAALAAFVTSLASSSGDPDVLVVGDLNAYALEDPVFDLTQAGLIDQLRRFHAGGTWSYVFDGEAGSLDHALATPTLSAQIAGAAHWAINADEPAVIDYNTEFKPQDLYSATPYRSSDHDPVLIGLVLSAAPNQQVITFATLADKRVDESPVVVSAAATSGLAVVFTSLTPSVCGVAANSVTLIAAGTCTIAADQPGDATWAPAPRVARSFAVSEGQSQVIDFAPVADRNLGSTPFAVAPEASSGLPVALASQTPSVCTVAGLTVSVVATGTCTLVASQAGNAQWLPAPPVMRSFSVLEPGAGAGSDADIPLPVWALALLGAGLAGALRRRTRAAS
ncbi:MAG: ExeM/NucH family extracellular endonuclease [Burkholderiales bacterium]